ncbi:MAG: UvrD-helicase domain-containing protein [Pseudomonadales bacterium]
MSDAQARLDAVQIDRSVIVQAPAGSGKTTLLVERYLGLLATVQAPEEILAITFTRKAAAEMRERVLRYLNPDFEPDGDHEQAAWNKAKAIRERVEQWQLLANPNRLLIRTIDSFNHYLARTMPVAGALGPVPTPADNTQALHRRAARKTLALIDSDDPLADDLDALLDWSDHQQQRIEDLLTQMLAERDQWQRVLDVAGGGQRAQQEAVLAVLVGEHLAEAHEALSTALAASNFAPGDLLRLAQDAAHSLRADGKAGSPIVVLADADTLPGAAVESLPLWRGLVELLCTGGKKPTIRKKVDKNIGFPPKAESKPEITELLAALAEKPPLAAILHHARSQPDPIFDDADWNVLEALIRVLTNAAGQLELVFAETRSVDYAGLAAAALRGMGNEQNGYTDLGLYLDQRISHILLDEFQDTNWSQLRLLEQLTVGWEPNDGRSLFLVGDPMQSIYRFREAEVGLFIRSRDQGVGAIQLQSAQLHNNFRSRTEIVEWVNDRLGPIFPATENIAAGAVTYAPSTPARASGGTVTLQAFQSPAAEAEAVVTELEVALAEQAHNPEFKAAIIVRARTHLQHILPVLNERGIGFRAVKLDPLLKRQVVLDLLAIAQTISQPADRSACLAVLRSPACGLTLADLTAFAEQNPAELQHSSLEVLSEDGRRRAAPVLEALRDAQQQWRRLPLRDLVEGTWHRIGGPACCEQPVLDMADAEAFLDALEAADTEGLLADWNDFMERLDRQYTQGDAPSPSIKVEVLTMHGAKGLEWDMVFLPQLHKQPGGGDSKLLYWVPFSDPNGGEAVLLAPLRNAAQADNSALTKLIQDEQNRREQYEVARLLYVAMTRAKEQLVLSCCIDLGDDGDKDPEDFKPKSGSLLAHLWETTTEDFLRSRSANAPATARTEEQADAIPDQQLRRVAADWQPATGARMDWHGAEPDAEAEAEAEAASAVDFNWAGVQARRSGSVLHRLLELAGKRGLATLDADAIERLQNRIPQLLQALGTQGAALEDATAVVAEAFKAALQSETGQWILDSNHSDAHSELALSGMLDGRLINAIIDRTFVDADGTRWIIDYKTGFHEGADLDAFFDEEARRYSDQLQRYRRLFAALEQRPINTALYLPRHDQLIMVPPSA